MVGTVETPSHSDLEFARSCSYLDEVERSIQQDCLGSSATGSGIGDTWMMVTGR